MLTKDRRSPACAGHAKTRGTTKLPAWWPWWPWCLGWKCLHGPFSPWPSDPQTLYSNMVVGWNSLPPPPRRRSNRTEPRTPRPRARTQTAPGCRRRSLRRFSRWYEKPRGKLLVTWLERLPQSWSLPPPRRGRRRTRNDLFLFF